MICRYPNGQIKTCFVHGPGNYSDGFKLLGDFGSNYAKVKPTKDRGNHPVPRKKNNRQQEKNSIVNNLVDFILIDKTQKVSAMREA